MKALRTLLAFIGAAAVLLGGAWAGGALAPAAHAAAGRPSRATDDLAYAKDGEIPIGDALVVNGQPMQLSIFYTKDEPLKVVEFYGQAFIDRGLTPVISRQSPMEHVAVFDPDDGMQRFITAVPQADGQTLVMVGITNPRKPPALLGGAKSAGFPVPEEHRAFLGYRSEDQGAHAESAQFVTSLTTAQTVAFYREQLVKDGYAELTNESSAGMILFSKGEVSLSVAVQALAAPGEQGKTGAAVFVNKLQGGVK
jgi:hypothetical protein